MGKMLVFDLTFSYIWASNFKKLNMKKTLIFALALTLGAGITSCKKGENDPFLSLKSRKARLVGEWTLTAAEEVETGTQFGFAYTQTTSYDGTTATTTYESNGTSTSTTDMYSQTVTINKDGTYSMTYTDTDTGADFTMTDSGNWLFMGKNKASETKNKEGVLFSSTSQSQTSAGVTSTSTNTGFTSGQIMLIDQLKGKEVIFKGEYSSTPAGTGATTTTTTYSYTYTAN